LSFIVIEPAFLRRLANSRRRSWTLGARAEPVCNWFRCNLCQKSRPPPEPVAKRKIGDQPGRLQTVAPPAISEPRSAIVALEASLDPPPAQGCAKIGNKVRAVGQPASPSDHGYSSARASVGQRCNACFR